MRMKLNGKTLILASLGIASLLTAGETVGTVVTPGRVLVNNLAVQGNASVTEGMTLKTTATAARVELSGGGVISLDAGSEAVLHRGRLQLRHGKGMLASQAGRIEALGLRVNSGAPQSQVLVAVNGNKVEVAAVRGSGKVSNQQGLTLAMIHKGRPLSFEPGAGNNQSTVTGTLRQAGSRYMLRDELTGIDVELQGGPLRDNRDRRVQASGEARITSDSDRHVVLVSRLSRLEPGADSTESAPNSSNPSTSTEKSTTTASGGMSAGTKISLAALAFGGMAAAIAVPIAMSN
jgi:hypothetical protein